MPPTKADYTFLREFILCRSANILDPLRDDLFDARLYRLMQAEGMAGIDELAARLKSDCNPALEQAVVEAMTINETSFFRDPAVFDLLREKLIPELIEQRAAQRALRFWSAACSSGQEAYSLAMLIRHYFPQLAGWKIEIVGTDIHAEMVRRAHRGRYQRIEVNRGLPARFLLKYFVRHEEEWEAVPEIRSLCRFQQRNLCQPQIAFECYDGILMRNVLFYFAEATQARILESVHSSLQPDGFLILGSSEQARAHHLWRPVLEGKSCYYTPR